MALSGNGTHAAALAADTTGFQGTRATRVTAIKVAAAFIVWNTSFSDCTPRWLGRKMRAEFDVQHPMLDVNLIHVWIDVL
jgi:hypothetical protein